ncbi:MAG: RodZ domain-containing protein [Anderseniella sp.]
MNQHTHGGFENDFQNYRSKPDGSKDPAGEAGWFLQRERERRKVNLRDVAQAIKVHPIHLDAIERGDLTRMPHRSDAIGMVGAYAEFLGFDPQPMMMHYAQVIPKQTAAKSGNSKQPSALGSARIIEFPLARRIKEMAEGVTKGGGGVVASICLAMVLFGSASYALFPGANTPAQEQIATGEGSGAVVNGVNTTISAQTETTEQPLPEASQLVAEIDPAVDPIGALLAAEADKAANDLGGLDKLIASDGRITGEIDSITTATAKPVEAIEKPVKIDGQGRIFGANNTDARLVLKATAPVWVRIEDGKGKAIITETLMEGDRFRVPNQEGLVVIARDGGLLSFEIDGKPWGNLGNPGQILVNRTLDINTLMNKGS